MRNLALALILLNLTFAGWRSWHSPGTEAASTDQREFGDIVLAAEFAEANPGVSVGQARVSPVSEPVSVQEPQPQPVVADVAIEPDNSVASAPPETVADLATSCMSVGPFRELSQVTAAAATLRADGLEPRQRAGEGDVWSGYWVYLERIDTSETAQSMIDALHSNGVSDAYIIPDSDSGILISLGVFSEIIRASRISERVGDLGFDATITDRVRRASVYWIDVELESGTALDIDRLRPAGRIVRLEQRPCASVDL